MSKHKSIAEGIIQSLSAFSDALKSGSDLGERFTCRRVVLDLRPEPYTPEKVKATRKKLRVSQPLFAKFLGVSVKTIRHWEQGLSDPSPMACRFMDEISLNPDYYLKRLSESLRSNGKGAKELV